MSLTERMVRDAKPDGKARTIWDKQVMGLGLQITPTGIKNYVIRYRVGDQKRQAILARAGQISLKDARERAGAELVRIRAGEADPLQRRRDAREAPTMAQFIEQFFAVEVPARIARGRMKPITAETYGYQSRTHILPAIGTRRVANVTRADIERMVASLPGPTRNRVLALASRLFTLAETWELRAPGTNPTRKIGAPARKRATACFLRRNWRHWRARSMRLKRGAPPMSPPSASRPSLSANITETPATFGISVGRWR